MEIVSLPLAGLKLIKPRVFTDDRGFFFEAYRKDVLAKAGVDVEFVQDNHSRSSEGTVRGLHFQKASPNGPGQAKLVRCARGKIFDVAVDIRPDSPTFGQWHAEVLDAHTHTMLFIPVGFAHGFAVLSEEGADVIYKCSSVYDGATEAGFAWNDPDVGVAWPVKSPVLSKRDMTAPSFAQLKKELGR